MQRYNHIVKKMQKEFYEEESVIDFIEKKEREQRKAKREEKKKKKQDSAKKESLKKESPTKEYLYKRAWELRQEGVSYREIATEIGLGAHKTAKRYVKKHQEFLDKEKTDIINSDNE